MTRRRGEHRRPRRSWPQRLLLSVNVVAILVCIASAVVIVYGHETVSATRRTSILDVEGWEPAERVAAGDPVNFLVVGNDSDEGLDPDDPIRDGRDTVSGIRSDVMMIIRLDPKESEAKVVSIPRDLWVTIPGRGEQRINAAADFGEDSGPSKLIETIRSELGITINHYVEVNFAGFKNIIEVIDGVKIYISHPLRDGHSGLDQPEVGCKLLDKHQALAYARSRHLEWQNAEGDWVADPSADIGRMRRQQEMLQRVVAQAIHKGARNPATLNRLIQKAQGSVKLDRYMTGQDLLDLGRAFDSFEPEDLQTSQLPVYDERRPGMWVLHLQQPQADVVLDQFRDTGSSGIAAEVDPADVNLRVLNGGAPEGSALTTSDALRDLGFRTQTPGDAEPVVRTEIRFSPSQRDRARFLARYVAADVVLVADRSVAEITLVIGPDHEGVLSSPKDESEVTDAVRDDDGSSAESDDEWRERLYEELGIETTTTDAASPETTTTTGSTLPTTTTTLDERGDPARNAPYVPSAIPDGVDC